MPKQTRTWLRETLPLFGLGLTTGLAIISLIGGNAPIAAVMALCAVPLALLVAARWNGI